MTGKVERTEFMIVVGTLQLAIETLGPKANPVRGSTEILEKSREV